MPHWDRFPLDPRSRVLAVLFPAAICLGWLIAVVPDGSWWWPVLAFLTWCAALVPIMRVLQWRGWRGRFGPPKHRA